MDVEEIEEEVPTAAVAYEGRFCPTPVASKGSLEHRSNQREALDSGQHQYGSADECFEQQAAETAKPAHNQETSRQQNASGNMQQQENLTKIYQQALRQGRLSPEPEPASKSPGVSSQSPAQDSKQQHQTRMCKPAPAASAGCTYTSSKRPTTADRLTSSRPLSAQLRTSVGMSKAVAQPAVQSITAHPAVAVPYVVAAAEHQHSSRSSNRLFVRRYTPGPGAYSPEIDRQGKCVSPTHAKGSFPTADRYEGSYIETFAKTMHSPGPIYFPSGSGSVVLANTGSRAGWPSASGSTTSGSTGTSHNGGLTRSSSLGNSRALTSPNVTAQATHSMNGSWNKADVGSREQLIVHRCHSPGSCCGAKCSSSGKPGSYSSSGACASSPGCAAAAGSTNLGPGSYDVSVAADGRGVLLTQSCPAFSVPKAGRFKTGRKSPFVSQQHAQHENQGSDSPGPVYNPDIIPTRPSSCSPTMRSRGTNHWDALYNSMRATAAKQTLGPNPISRGSKRLLGDGPHAHFGTSSLELQQWPLISGRHSRVLYSGRHGAENRYKPSYAQVDAHVGGTFLASGPKDRFEDVSCLSYITHATGQTQVR